MITLKSTIENMPIEISELPSGLKTIEKIAVSKAGIIVTSYLNREIHVLPLATAAAVEEAPASPSPLSIPGQDSYTDMAVDAATGEVFVGGYDGSIYRYDPESGNLKEFQRLEDGYPEKMWAGQGKLVFTSRDIIANVISASGVKEFLNPEGTYIQRLDGFETATGFILVANGVGTEVSENNLVIWDTESGRELINHKGILPIKASAFDKESGRLFIGYDSGRIDVVRINPTSAEFVGNGVQLDTEDRSGVTHLQILESSELGGPMGARGLMTVSRSGLVQIRNAETSDLTVQEQYNLGDERIHLKVENDKAYAITGEGKLVTIDLATKVTSQMQLVTDPDAHVTAAQIVRNRNGDLVVVAGTSGGGVVQMSLPE